MAEVEVLKPYKLHFPLQKEVKNVLALLYYIHSVHFLSQRLRGKP